jgi:hypothetical protein
MGLLGRKKANLGKGLRKDGPRGKGGFAILCRGIRVEVGKRASVDRVQHT